MSKTLGILGGMGPEATAAFYKYVIELTPAEQDQQHLRTLIISDPTVPDRTAYLLGKGESPGPRLVELARNLELMGAELIAIPCNTAHVFYRAIADSVKVPVLNIIEETVTAVAGKMGEEGGPGRIAVLATRGTIEARLYQRLLEENALVPLLLESAGQEAVQEIIELIKAQKKGSAQRRLVRAIDSLAKKGAHGVILGCTELGLVLEPEKSGILVFDSLRILAEATVHEAFMHS